MGAAAGVQQKPATLISAFRYVWASGTHDPSRSMPAPEKMGRDFLAVFDVAEFRRFREVDRDAPRVGTKAQMAHDTNYDMPADGRLFASDYMSGEGYVFDLRAAQEP